MQSKNGLVPTTVIDKNGKRTTVHRRPSEQASAGTSKIPAPDIAQRPVDRGMALDVFHDAVIREYQLNPADFDDRIDLQSIMGIASRRSDEVLAVLHQALTNGSDHTTVMLDAVSSQQASDTVVSEVIAFAPCLRTGAVMLSAINGLREYGSAFPYMEDYTKATGRTREQVRGLLTVVSILGDEYPNGQEWESKGLPIEEITDNNHRWYARINNGPLLQYVLENPEHAERISEIILHRKTIDTTLIDSIIHSDAPSISDGLL